jgi:hypothetical protein
MQHAGHPISPLLTALLSQQQPEKKQRGKDEGNEVIGMPASRVGRARSSRVETRKVVV